MALQDSISEATVPATGQQAFPADGGVEQNEPGKPEAAAGGWDVVGLLTSPIKAVAKVVPDGFPSVGTGAEPATDAAAQPVRPAQGTAAVGRATVAPTEVAGTTPAVRETPRILENDAVKQIIYASDPVAEAVRSLTNNLQIVNSIDIKQNPYDQKWRVNVDLVHGTTANMIDKRVDIALWYAKASTTYIGHNFALTADLSRNKFGGTNLDLNCISGITPTADIYREFPLRRRKPDRQKVEGLQIDPLYMNLEQSNAWGAYHIKADGQAHGRTRQQTICPNEVNDVFLRNLMTGMSDLPRALNDLNKLQDSGFLKHVNFSRVHNPQGIEQFSLNVEASHDASPIEINEKHGAITVKSVDLAANFGASLTYSHDTGVSLVNIHGVKVTGALGSFEQTVVPNKVAFAKDQTGNPVIAIEVTMQNRDGTPGGTFPFSIPFSTVLEKLKATK